MDSVCVLEVELHVTANHIKMLSVAQQWFYSKFMLSAIMQKICTRFLNK
jgi:hypothetical protein